MYSFAHSGLCALISPATPLRIRPVYPLEISPTYHSVSILYWQLYMLPGTLLFITATFSEVLHFWTYLSSPYSITNDRAANIALVNGFV